MLTRNLCRVLLLALLSPTATMALGLGDIHLKSSLNAPLDADIDVVGASADELSGLKAALASRETFNRYRLEYPAFLAGIMLEPRQTADGRTVLHMHSADAVNEPIATVLIEVNWARGHLVREYTVLLDPPVFSGDSASAGGAAVAAPVTGEAARSGNVERRVASAPTPSASATAATVAAPSAGSAAAATRARGAGALSSGASTPTSTPSSAGGATPNASSYTVRSGDTLTGITAQVYGAGDHTARQRELVAVYRANTAAFDGNMNILRSGSRLTMPGESELTAISPGEAAAEVHRQYSSWNAAHGVTGGASASAAGSGQLRLVPPQEAASAPSKSAAAPPANAPSAPSSPSSPSAGTTSAAASGAAAAASAALQQRVTQLESQLADSQRLLQMKNAELAQLQSRPGQAPVTPTAPTPAPAPVTPAATPPSAAAPAPTPTPTPPPAAAPPAAEAPVAAPPPPAAVKPPPAPAAAPPSTSFLDLLVQYWYLPAALVAVLVVLLVMRAVRARQEDAFDRSLGRLSTPGFDNRPAPEQPQASDTVPVRALAPSREEQSYRVEESGAHEQPPGAAAALADTAASGRHVAIDDSVPTEAPVALDQGDPLAEADFHMAYGLYDQAADLVQIAISREPERRDLRLKLLEVFFVWGNKDRFLQAARELASTREKALPGEWEKIVIMGRQIAPEDPLFGASGALTGAASGGVDLNLEGGQNRIDFDLMGEPTVGAPGGGRSSGVDLDLGAALGDTAVRDADATHESRPGSESGVDFVFDDAERGNEQTGSTREMPSRSGQATTMTAAVASDPDAPTVEQPQLPPGDNPTIRQKIDAATRGGVVSSEQTAELELHDLGLDLGSMDTGGDETEIAPSAADVPTMLAGTGDETRQLLHQADTERGKDDRAPIPGEPTDSGTWLFTDTDFVDVATTPGVDRNDAPTELVTQLSPRPEFEPQPDSSSTARLAAIESAGLDLDLGDLDKTMIKGVGDSNGVDLDVGAPAPSASEGTFVQTQRIMAEDIPLPDLEPATMSEVGTKLDLARAYMDMGDPEGARSILSEVLSEGSVSQKQEARRLIDTLPG